MTQVDHNQAPQASTEANEALLDEQLDHIMDTEGISYADARLKLGLAPPDNSEFTEEKILARNPSMAPRLEDHAEFGRRFNLTGVVHLSPSQQSVNEAGQAAVRSVLSKSKTSSKV